MKRRFGRTVLLSALAWGSGAPLSASAQTTDPAAAEVLFREARELLSQGKLAEACPKFIESHRLDPASGTLLAVARCHEEQGLFATAWAEFTQAKSHAQTEGRLDRAELAQQRLEALEPRLSTLTLSVAPEVLAIPGLGVKRDGIEVSSVVFNRALPIDGGTHHVELSAPGHVPEKLTIVVAREGDKSVLSLPVLKRTPSAAAPPPAEPAPAAKVTPVALSGGAPLEHDPGLTGRQKLGVGISVAGLGALGVGGAFLIAALVKKDQSNAYCTVDDECSEETGVQDRSDAVAYGNVATALGIGGLVLTGLGVSLYWWGGNDDEGPVRSALLRFQGSAERGAVQLELGF